MVVVSFSDQQNSPCECPLQRDGFVGRTGKCLECLSEKVGIVLLPQITEVFHIFVKREKAQESFQLVLLILSYHKYPLVIWISL